MPDGSSQWRWVKQIWVIRADDIACYEEDMGSEDDFQMVTPMAIYSEGDESVAECKDAGDRNRVDHYWRTRLKEQQATSTLMAGVVEQMAKVSKVIRNQTVSGPAGTIQRNGYDHTHAVRKMLDRKHQVSGRTQF